MSAPITIDEQKLFEKSQENELRLFKQKQIEERNAKYNELNDADALIINEHYQDDVNRYKVIINRMLTSCDFVNSGSYSAKYCKNKKHKKFNNMMFLIILENMVESKEIKVKLFGKYKYYYTRLSEEEVENMSELDVKSRLWQNLVS